MIIELSVRNLARSPRRSLLVGALLSMGILLAVIGNDLFETAREGLRRSLVGCFTGDLYVSQRSAEVFGLLGSSTPSIGAFASIPVLNDYARVVQEVDARKDIDRAVSQVSGAANLEFMGFRTQAMMFGVDGDEYFRAFPSIGILEGSPLATGTAGLLLSRQRVEDIAELAGRRPVPGDIFLLSVSTDRGFQLREAPLTGVFEYSSSNDVLDRIAYVDAGTLESYSRTLASPGRPRRVSMRCSTWNRMSWRARERAQTSRM